MGNDREPNVYRGNSEINLIKNVLQIDKVQNQLKYDAIYPRNTNVALGSSLMFNKAASAHDLVRAIPIIPVLIQNKNQEFIEYILYSFLGSKLLPHQIPAKSV